ncbi:MAG: cytochrome c biogenesis protein CcsA [Bacteroidetes bacterium]|nr:cytochrome c biogenesis protein CcsA [Bacteroidota bacterium]
MTWIQYPYFVYAATLLWLAGIIISFSGKGKTAGILRDFLLLSGTAVIVVFAGLLWDSLERPPFRTLAETRLWYAIFTAVIGLVIYYRWKMKWMLGYALTMAIVFLFINYFKPDTFDKTLMPALQSPWFIPHVIVYIIGYALLAVSSLIGIKGLYLLSKGNSVEKSLWIADNMVYIGFAFLTFGLLFGALWAKEAWGHYWTWDPKETWAFITWLVYLLYIHFRINKRKMVRTSLWILSLAFVALLICWFGINYLPSAQSSVHVYSP